MLIIRIDEIANRVETPTERVILVHHFLGEVRPSFKYTQCQTAALITTIIRLNIDKQHH